MLSAGCASETEAGEDDVVDSSADALKGFGPCPPCAGTSCIDVGACIGTRLGAIGCKAGEISSSKKTVAPEAWIQSASCEDWWDRTSGEGQIYSRTCTQRSFSEIYQFDKCVPASDPKAGPYMMRWVSTYFASKRVKRTRSEIQVSLVNPVASTSPWTAWSKE
jgi:hypothetical protein